MDGGTHRALPGARPTEGTVAAVTVTPLTPELAPGPPGPDPLPPGSRCLLQTRPDRQEEGAVGWAICSAFS